MAKWKVEDSEGNLIGAYLKPDPVNKPPHYASGSIECIDYIKSFLTKEEYIGYLRGNMAKYNHRARYKGKFLEDIKKAQWYSTELIKTLEETE